MRKSSTLPTPVKRGFCCPQCAGDIERVSRRLADRLLSLWLPVGRYRCRSWSCRWEGLLLRRAEITPGTELRRL